MESARKTNFCTLIICILSGIVIVLSSLILIGWFTHNEKILYALPSLRPTTLSTAISLILLSASLSIENKYPKYIFILSTLSIFIILSDLIGIRWNSHLIEGNLTICFFIIIYSILIMLLTVFSKNKWLLILSTFFASFFLMIIWGAVFNYTNDYHLSFAWELWSPLSGSTGILFLFFGFAFLVKVFDKIQKASFPEWVFFIIVICFSIIGTSLIFAEKIYYLERHQIKKNLSHNLYDFSTEAKKNIEKSANEIIVDREHWEKTYRNSPKEVWIDHLSSLIPHQENVVAMLWVDPNNKIIWSQTKPQFTGIDHFIKKQSHLFKTSYEKAKYEEKTILSNAFTYQKKSFHLIIEPFYINKKLTGFLVGAIPIKSLLKSISDREPFNKYEILITEKENKNQESLIQTTSFSLYGYTWKITAKPTDQLMKSATTHVPLLLFLSAFPLSALLSILIYLLNITQKREKEIKKYAENVSKINIELDKFAYIVSHDLKAPLRAIQNLATWIQEDLGDHLKEETKKHIDMLSRRAQRMKNLIDGILKYSRAGRMDINISTVNVKQLLEEIIESLNPPKLLKITIDENMPVLVTPAITLSQVFSNLISNAINYMDKENGEIDIQVKDVGDYYQFSVRDNGPGIEPKNFERIFELFQTLHSKDAIESSGVGLTIAKKMVEWQKGKIWVESAVGKGSTFYFTWPKQPRHIENND